MLGEFGSQLGSQFVAVETLSGDGHFFVKHVKSLCMTVLSNANPKPFQISTNKLFLILVILDLFGFGIKENE